MNSRSLSNMKLKQPHPQNALFRGLQASCITSMSGATPRYIPVDRSTSVIYLVGKAYLSIKFQTVTLMRTERLS
jgi:hypothetical protein